MNREAERKRLVEILKQNCHCINEDCEKCSSNGICFTHREADHLLDNGIIVPPVKVGNKVYKIFTKYTPFVNDYKVENYGVPIKDVLGHYQIIPFDDFGKTVFTSREEAEKALGGVEK